jgi:RNA polymerase sigma factor (sigma-70 family)
MARHDGGDGGTRASKIKQAMASSQEAFFNCCWPWLLHILLSQASDSGLAEEAAADTIKTAFDKWDDLLIIERPDSWLYKVAIRRLRRMEAQARARGRLVEVRAGIEADLRRVSATDEWVAQNLDLVTALRLLPRRQAEVLVLRGLGECTERETADILGVSEGTVKTQLYRARKKLRLLLEVRVPS